ncbi:MAG: malto-oligosyltrehalose synthase [Pseudomonadota bacterium]
MAGGSLVDVTDSRPVPRATYRLQLNRDFGFDQAADLAPYLARLGVSHVYCSPYLMARPGSTHGYDIISHTALNPELGDARAFQRMCDAFRAEGLGQILDFVPNHMGVGGADNPWWLDVLEWGQDSEFAGWFDIDWAPDRPHLKGKILVPFLGDQYGAELRAGALRLKFDTPSGTLAVWAYDTHKLPITPVHYARVLGNAHPELERMGDAFAHLARWRPQVPRAALEMKAELARAVAENADVADALQAALARFEGEPGDLQSWARLDALIQEQYWRAAHFRVAADDINYRRFFNINDLAGVRMELPALFDHAHGLVFDLLARGILDGIRLDHVDGLLDPKGYCLRLREKAPRPFYLLVEKILAPHENLREDWDVDGTTGYEFANLLTGLLIDPAGEVPLSEFYVDFTGARTDFSDIVRECRMRIMDHEMASELDVLAREAARVARSNPLTTDFTKNVIQAALKEIIAVFPVYRTYVDGRDPPTDADRRDIDWAVAKARRNGADLDPSVFDFLHGLLTCDLAATPRGGFSRVEVVGVAMRAQQYSGPVMAKGLEDTALYRFNRMLALNEVGGRPEQFSVSLSAFHHANAQRAKRSPAAMLATSTHDTKRGEDARARLCAVSEVPDEWGQQVRIWSRMLRARSAGTAEETPPDRNDEYAFYQMLAGAWPPEFSGADRDFSRMDDFRARVEGAMTKAMREAKVHTTWAAPNMSYEDAVLDFIRHALDATRTNPFLEAFSLYLDRIAPLGVHNSLIQTVLKLTAPGVPDLYQGSEFWDFSLVDPDNRRPVDYAERAAALGEEGAGAEHLAMLLDQWGDGRIKLHVSRALLELRARDPRLFRSGGYEPLTATGAQADRICAFARRCEGRTLVTVAALSATRGAGAALEGCHLPVPDGAGGRWRDVLSGRVCDAGADGIDLSDLLHLLPVAVLMEDRPETGA